MLALGIVEGFAPGLVSLHTTPLLGRKPSSVKSRVSISSKLIEIKGFQLQHFGHLRKTGGRGSYRLVHTTHHPVRKSPAAKSNYSAHPTKDVHPEPTEGPVRATSRTLLPASPSAFSSRISTKSLISPTYEISTGNSFLSPTCAKTGGGGLSS
jgi:hypothetical protein